MKGAAAGIRGRIGQIETQNGCAHNQPSENWDRDEAGNASLAAIGLKEDSSCLAFFMP
jgi:hypothetical protein